MTNNAAKISHIYCDIPIHALHVELPQEYVLVKIFIAATHALLIPNYTPTKR